MPATAIAQLVHLLADSAADTRDSASLRLPSEVLELSVAGVGPVRFPVRPAQVKQLAAVARVAAFGKGHETLQDTSVRDTWEITPEQVVLGGQQWQATLDAALQELAFTLGLPDGARFHAELHSMLVYGKGQFFAPHQDSEKHDNMVATMVLSLPSAHTGGELVIDDRGELVRYSGSRDEIVMVAFYADRRHEVLPVRSGNRVTLTFDLGLVVEGNGEPPEAAAKAAALLRKHFATPQFDRHSRQENGTATRLVYLLDHEYSRHSLQSGLFKGRDADRVALLRAAAELAGLDTVLAQIDLRESWSAVPIRNGRTAYYEDDDPGIGISDGEYEVGHPIDGTTHVTWWTDTEIPGEVNLTLPQYQVFSVTPTHALSPYDSEHQGYMGNYGNTVERWYHRTALVMWPTDRGVAARAEVDPGWALQTLLDLVRRGDPDRARLEARSFAPFWKQISPVHLTAALRVAAALQDSAAAGILLAPFQLNLLAREQATLLATLDKGHDRIWWEQLRENWSRDRWPRPDEDRAWVIGEMSALCSALRRSGAPRAADRLIRWVWAPLSGRIQQSAARANPEIAARELAHLGPELSALLTASDTQRSATIVAEVCAGGPSILPLLTATLRTLDCPPTPAITTLARETQERLRDLLDTSPRRDDDWSISWASPGGQEMDALAAFLHSPTSHVLTWPLAEQGRVSVERVIEESGLPVRLTILRSGRPHSLVLEKTAQLFRRETERRRQAEADLVRLDRTYGAVDNRIPIS